MPVHVPGSLERLLSLLEPCFSQPVFQTFRALAVGFIARVGVQRWACVRAAPPRPRRWLDGDDPAASRRMNRSRSAPARRRRTVAPCATTSTAPPPVSFAANANPGAPRRRSVSRTTAEAFIPSAPDALRPATFRHSYRAETVSPLD